MNFDVNARANPSRQRRVTSPASLRIRGTEMKRYPTFNRNDRIHKA